MANREWVTSLHILGKAVSSHLCIWPTASEYILWKEVWWHLFLWPTASKWHCILCERQSNGIFCYDQQRVCDISFCERQPIMSSDSSPMTNSLWVILHTWWKAVLLSLPYDQQRVSDIAQVLRKSLSPYFPVLSLFPMTNRMWVTLHIWWKAVSTHLSYEQQFVSDIAHFVKGSLSTPIPMINSLWVTLHIL